MSKLTLRDIQQAKNKRTLHMLTAYDYPTACILNQTALDMILVGDSLANVVLGFSTTIPATLEMMTILGSAVRRGAPDKFLILDAPFGSYSTFTQAVQNLSLLFKTTQAEAVKLEGASPFHLKVIERLVETGVPVMGHIGLQPQSVHAQGGYRKHGKNNDEIQKLKLQAKKIEEAGAFSVVLECVEEHVAREITNMLSIPTIGIGSGEAKTKSTDGQVLVYHDLLGLNYNRPPKFVTPVANLFLEQKNLIEKYLQSHT